MDKTGEAAALYEELICKVQGVFSAKVKVDEEGRGITECHVLADRTRNVKQLVRDVQSSLMAKFHVDLDYKLISVAQVDNLNSVIASARADVSAQAWKQPSGTQLKSFMVGYDGNNIKAVVTISLGGQTFSGEASGINGSNSGFRTLAQAVVNAFGYNADGDTALDIIDVQKFNICGQGAYAVAVFHRSSGYEETLLGASMIREDENMAVVKAALDALNRRLFMPGIKSMGGDIGSTPA